MNGFQPILPTTCETMVESQFPQLRPIGASNELEYGKGQYRRTREAGMKKLLSKDEERPGRLTKDEFPEKAEGFSHKT
jgi:hypothetical protein